MRVGKIFIYVVEQDFYFLFFNFSSHLAGVASGATRAALTQHFALQSNAADISAKVQHNGSDC